MKLYFTPGACSLAPHIVLREAGLPFELDRVDLSARKTQGGADFYTISPKGQVPALVLDDGTLLTEVPAVVQYVADLKPDAGLIPPAGTPERYRVQEWLNFISSEVHKNLGQLFRPDMPRDWRRIITDTAGTKFSYLDHHLANNDYLMGRRFGAADTYAFAIVNWSGLFDIDLAPWRNLVRYIDRVGTRPRVREAMQAEGLVRA